MGNGYLNQMLEDIKNIDQLNLSFYFVRECCKMLCKGADQL